ncbi:MAG: serine hydrolase domain-containing protein [Ruthenibacterium sp.]
MELRSGVKTLNYIKKFLLRETDGILPYPVRVQKPVPQGRAGTPLPRALPAEAGVPPAALEAFLRALAGPQHGAHTALVARGGRVVCEAQFAPYSLSQWHVTHSLAKSFAGTAIGMLRDEGRLSLDERAADIFSDKCGFFTSRRAKAVTVRHLLTMSSSCGFKEYGMVLEADWVKAFLDADYAFEPGEKMEYNSMNTYMLAAIVRRKTGEGLMEYLRPRLFEPLGFSDVAWETCPLGTEKGGWGMYVHLEDALKLGLVYLNGGVWHAPQGEVRIFSREWAEEATAQKLVRPETGEGYAYQLWTDEARGTYMFNGMFGQYVVLCPSLDMAVAVNAGAGNLFTKSGTLRAIEALFAAVQGAAADGPPRDGAARLAFALGHLHFGMPVPPYPRDVPLGARLRQAFQRAVRRLLPAPEAGLAQLCGKTFRFGKNSASLLPMVTAVMNDYYPKGVESVRLEQADSSFRLLWEAPGESQCVPFVPGGTCEMKLTAGGNVFETAVQARFTQDEDGRPVLRLALHMLEESSSRILKLVFCPSGRVELRLDETPPLMLALHMLEKTSPGALQVNLEQFKDLDYLWYCVERTCAPVLQSLPENGDGVFPPAPALM